MHLTKEKITAYIQLMRFDKPIGTLLLLWPTLWALFLSKKGMPDFSILFIFICGVIFMRAAGCVINDYADRNIDNKVKRTNQRPITTGRITEKEAKILFSILLISAFILTLFLNIYAIVLSFVAAILAFIYPFMKRYTHLPQVFLGAAFGWAIPMAYGATNANLPLECWLLFLANMSWTVAYDTQYAMVDRDDDILIGVKSTAILFGKNENKIISLLQVISLTLLGVVGYITELNIAYYLFLLLTSFLFIYQYKLTRQRIRENCFKAFLNNNYVGLLIFIAFLIGLS
ncbi:4-hydroxybenzoate polyprenyltransferase [Bisgaardia hudsonensis]|uniref:4-hydroxybenzoate octaprenyltransferase n=1 Tax=Bisgaardia hudsonensis TaxID=109472 RepID=A0A4R2MVJ0_9PAST|nr:4-hydroxybenzoate octaprenyltransferase [Bisgaardia hudsonensis]QLB12287.1 4-hydroxybenzoate polyprenyltransferase [Bisgaardia hudsonensis]TCP12331.1 4-hydroxybenzoate polyprenyltransferase [Bisgaardia hudsonensis]